MPRVKQFVTKEDVTDPAALAVFEKVGSAYGHVRGPSSILMHSPALCDRIFEVSAYLRFHGELTAEQVEWVILTVARERNARFIWADHIVPAQKAGVRDEFVQAVRSRAAPVGLTPDEADVFLYVQQLCRSSRTNQNLFDRLKDRYGTPWIVELTGLAGCYLMLGVVAEGFEIEANRPGDDQLPE